VRIRKATVKDVNQISELLLALANQFIFPTLTDQGQENLSRSMSPESIRHLLDTGYDYHVGCLNNEIIGVVATRADTHLYHLFVRQQNQAKGYSRLLWQYAKARCIAGENTGTFTVNSSLNAESVYQSWGFVPDSGIREANGVKDIPMTLKLN
jgi:GNAT superfamily N-acetyltransferase